MRKLPVQLQFFLRSARLHAQQQWRSSSARAVCVCVCAVIVSALCVSACGQSSITRHTTTSPAKPTRVSVCRPGAREAVGRFFDVPSSDVSVAAAVGNNAYPQCTFGVALAHGVHVQAVANDDNGPQPYAILERTETEQSQQFTAQRMIAAPTPVSHLGLDAWWFPAESNVMTTDGVQLITVTVNWPHATQARKRALADKLARTYLENVKDAQALARGEY